MNIKSPADDLWPLVKKMGAKLSVFEPDIVQRPPIEIELESGSGIEIELKDVETPGGLLGFSGRQVVLYIPDQGRNIDKVLVHGPDGKKVHVADCITLEEMREKNRFERYRAVANTTGEFEVFGASSSTGQEIAGKANLRVCINCLKHLNYKGYVTDRGRAGEILSNFNLEEFFLAYSTLFRYLPKTIRDKQGGYVANWPTISNAFRVKRNWLCEGCGLNLESHRTLLHTHHIDGNKAHNEDSNLRALCADCHRKQPMHDYMYISPGAMVAIQRLRHQQGVFDKSCDWEELLELVDSSFSGLLRLYQSEKEDLPEVGYDIMNAKGEVVLQAELAWPEKQTAVVHDETEKEQLLQMGWNALTLSDALRAQR